MSQIGNYKVDLKPKQEAPQTFTDKEAQMLDAAIKYTRYLKAKHPQWSPSKIQRRVGAHFQIKFV